MDYPHDLDIDDAWLKRKTREEINFINNFIFDDDIDFSNIHDDAVGLITRTLLIAKLEINSKKLLEEAKKTINYILKTYRL